MPAKAAPPTIASDVLLTHFEDAVAIAGELICDDPGNDMFALLERQHAWQVDLDVLSLNGAAAAEQVLLPVLRGEQSSAQHRLAASLALLQLRNVDGPRLVFESVAAGHAPAIKALSVWPDPQAEEFATTCFTSSDSDARLAWLEVFETRAADPGPQILAELLGSAKPEPLAAGLRLLPLHAKCDEHSALVDRNLSFGPALVRREAIVAGLVLRRPTAWMMCKAASRISESGKLRLLLAMLGSDEELASLIAWATKAAAPADTWWALGLSGRRPGILACLDRMERADVDARRHALAGFRAATGSDASDEDTAHAWWEANQSRFGAELRYLGGHELNAASLAIALRNTGYELRVAFNLELLVRTRGTVRLPTRALPEQALAVAEQTAELELDLQQSYAELGQ